jgi:sensor histidine kinase regulating citrate/malate metabolism
VPSSLRASWARGHGFGLHSSAVAAQQLGGTVAAISAGAGLGACFTVKIPFKVASHSERVNSAAATP